VTDLSRMEFCMLALSFHAPTLEDVETETRDAVRRSIPATVPAGRVAVAVGSRGIRDIARICRTAISTLRELGFSPFIVPAMGSHGGATAEGQKATLASLGITEEAMGCPVVSSQDVVLLGETDEGLPVYCDRAAAEATGIVVINRIKPHTSFSGPIESGLTKMLAVGLGKQAGARAIHQYGPEGLATHIPAVAKKIIEKIPVLMGLGIIENALEETAAVVGVRGDKIITDEPDLLLRAKSLMPRLPFEWCDVLVVEEMGKDISGVGMDPAITGRMGIQGMKDPGWPRVSRLVVLGLTEATHGNAHGVGAADFVTERLKNAIDIAVTYRNSLTAGFPEKAKIPLTAKNDREAILFALATCGRPVSHDTARVVVIKNTLSVRYVLATRPLWEEVKGLDWVRRVSGWSCLRFTPSGELESGLPHGGSPQA